MASGQAVRGLSDRSTAAFDFAARKQAGFSRFVDSIHVTNYDTIFARNLGVQCSCPLERKLSQMVWPFQQIPSQRGQLIAESARSGSFFCLVECSGYAQFGNRELGAFVFDFRIDQNGPSQLLRSCRYALKGEAKRPRS